jgi:hypothetical protein
MRLFTLPSGEKKKKKKEKFARKPLFALFSSALPFYMYALPT